MMGKIWNSSLAASHSWTSTLLLLVGLGHPYIVIWPSAGLGCHLASFHMIHSVSIEPLILWYLNAATLWSRVADMFKSIILLQFTSLPPPLILWFAIYRLFLISCRWWGKHYGPPMMGRLLSTSAHYPGDWSRDPLWYLRACIPQWQVLRTWQLTFIIGHRLGDSMSVRLQPILHTLWIVLDNTLRTIGIIGGFSRAC